MRRRRMATPEHGCCAKRTTRFTAPRLPDGTRLLQRSSRAPASESLIPGSIDAEAPGRASPCMPNPRFGPVLSKEPAGRECLHRDDTDTPRNSRFNRNAGSFLLLPEARKHRTGYIMIMVSRGHGKPHRWQPFLDGWRSAGDWQTAERTGRHTGWIRSGKPISSPVRQSRMSTIAADRYYLG